MTCMVRGGKGGVEDSRKADRWCLDYPSTSLSLELLGNGGWESMYDVAGGCGGSGVRGYCQQSCGVGPRV